MIDDNYIPTIRSIIWAALAPARTLSKSSDDGSKGVYGPTCPLPPWQFELTHIYQSVCADPSASLIHYLYADNPSWEFEAEAVKMVWSAFIAQNPIKPKKAKALSGLCYLALQNYKHQICYSKNAHSISRIIEISGVSASNWQRDWLPWWRTLQAVVACIDIEALTRLACVIDIKD